MPFPPTPFTERDNFTRADEGPPPSASWFDFDTGLKVLSNLCAGNAAGDNIAAYTATTFTVNAAGAYKVAVKPGDTLGMAVYFMQPGILLNGFVALFTQVAGASNDTHQLFRIDNGSVVGPLASGVREIAVDDVVSYTREKNRHSIQVGAVGGTWTEVAAATDWRYDGPGTYWLNIQGTTGRISSFLAADLPPAPPDTTPGFTGGGGYDPPRTLVF